MAVFGPTLQFLKLRSATCESRSPPPPLSFLLKVCVIVLHTHRYHPPNFNQIQSTTTEFRFSTISRVLLLACLLLLLLLLNLVGPP